MISALKITADRMADSGVFRCMTLSAFRTGKVPANMAGMMAKYFATSLAIENVVSAPRVISSCFPICTISMSLVGLESRSTMLPASLAACVPVFMATPTSACARAGASLVPSPVIATSLPWACSLRIKSIFSLGVAWARKSSTPASVAMAAAVSGLSPVIMTVLIPMARSWSKRGSIRMRGRLPGGGWAKKSSNRPSRSACSATVFQPRSEWTMSASSCSSKNSRSSPVSPNRDIDSPLLVTVTKS